MVIRTGSRRCRRARESSRRGIVAENRTVCRVVRGLVEDRLEVLGEAHVEHLVGLVEDDGGDVAEPQAAAVEQVERPAGRRDDDVDAGLQGAQLADDRLRRRRPAARGRRGPCRSGAAPPTPGRRARGWARGRAPTGRALACGARAAAGGSAGRRRRSCRCRWRPGRAGRGPPPAAGSPPAGSASAPRSRGRTARAAAPAGDRGRRRWVRPCSCLVRRPSAPSFPGRPCHARAGA